MPINQILLIICIVFFSIDLFVGLYRLKEGAKQKKRNSAPTYISNPIEESQTTKDLTLEDTQPQATQPFKVKLSLTMPTRYPFQPISKPLKMYVQQIHKVLLTYEWLTAYDEANNIIPELSGLWTQALQNNILRRYSGPWLVGFESPETESGITYRKIYPRPGHHPRAPQVPNQYSPIL